MRDPPRVTPSALPIPAVSGQLVQSGPRCSAELPLPPPPPPDLALRRLPGWKMSSLGAIWEQMVADAGCGTPRALPTGGRSLFPDTDVTQHISQRILDGPSEVRLLVWVALLGSRGAELEPMWELFIPQRAGWDPQYNLHWRKGMFPGIWGCP